MGQNHSSTKSTKSASVIIVDNFPTYEDKTGDHNINPSNQIDDSDPTFGYCCCNIKRAKKSSIDNQWKKLMVDQLEELDLEIWPKQLLKYLKKYNANVDGFYQGDLVWAYKNSSVLERKSLSYQSILSHQKDESFLEKSDLLSTTERKSIVQTLDMKATSEAVQGMIEASHILDEKFYEENHKDTWMGKSFNIKPEQAQMMNESMRRLRQEPEAAKFGLKKKGKRLPELYSSAAKSAEYTRKHIEKYKNNTFVNQLPAAAHEKQENEESTEDLYQNVLKYKTVTQTIDRHTKQKKNIFYQLITKFTAYFEETYNPVLQKARQKELPKMKLKEYSAKATVDLQQFIRIIFEGLCSYYRFDCFENSGQSGKDLFFNRDNLINFITSLVFTGPIYSIIFEFYKLEDRETEESFQKKLKSCKKFRPQDFGVTDEYCLNELTVKHFLANKMIPEKPTHLPAVEILKGIIDKPSYNQDGLPIIEEQKETYQTYQESKTSSEDFSEAKEDELDQRYTKIIQGHQPYRDAIMALTNLKYRNSPIHKLKNIVKVAELVTKSIESFYAEFNLTSYNKLDSDQTLSIFLYIVSKSGASDILAHCKIIEKFSTINILSSVSGYYATTLEACVNCICSMKIDETPSTEDIKPELKEFMRSVRWNSLGGPAGSSRNLDKEN